MSQKSQKVLEIQGIGYRAQNEKGRIIFSVGYPILSTSPYLGHRYRYREANPYHRQGIDRQLVGQTAAEIRDLRLRDIYKGKGIRHEGEVVKLKAGKAGKTGA